MSELHATTSVSPLAAPIVVTPAVVNVAVETAPAAAPTAEPRLRRRGRSVWSTIKWIGTDFGMIAAIRRRHDGRSKAEEIVVYTVHQAFYLWSLILIGFVGATCVHHWPGTQMVWGWIYVFVLLYTMTSFLFDVSTTRALLWGGAFCFVWVCSKYLEDLKHLTVLSGVWHYMRNLRPELNPGMASVISWMLLMPWIGSLFHSFGRGRKAFSPNSIEERFIGEGREITDRSGLKFRTRYRDLFETVLGLGAGDLEAVDSNHHVVKRWDNILCLFFIWPKLDEILHQRSAIVDNTKDEPVEVQEVKT